MGPIAVGNSPSVTTRAASKGALRKVWKMNLIEHYRWPTWFLVASIAVRYP